MTNPGDGTAAAGPSDTQANAPTTPVPVQAPPPATFVNTAQPVPAPAFTPPPAVPTPVAFEAPTAVAPAGHAHDHGGQPKRGHAGVIIMSILFILALLGGGAGTAFEFNQAKKQADETTKSNNQIVTDQAQIADLNKQLTDAKSQLSTAQTQLTAAQQLQATCSAAVSTIFSETDPAKAQAAALTLLQKCGK
jgi:uncharacterized protein HemX